MGTVDESLQAILEDLLKEHVSDGVKLMDSTLNEEVRSLINSKLASDFLERLKSRMLNNLETSKEIEKEFEDAVLRTWRKPLELLDLLLSVCLEISNSSPFEGESESSKRNYIREAVAKQQANACLVFNEILHLLKSGFPNGALYHWKTLHEIVCVSYFISKQGKDVAKRFLDYETVELYLQAEAFREHHQNVDCASFSQGDLKALEKQYLTMEKLYGDDFVKKSNYPYGWIPREVLKTRSFKEIEKSVSLDTFRAYYDLAGYNLHGGQNGLIFKLGAMKKNNHAVVAVGPSNYGLADPGRSAAIALGQATACFLMSYSGVKKHVIVEALRNLIDEICDAFGEIEAEFGKN